ncbi:AGD8, partial [Symbiodinium necroappetens]
MDWNGLEALQALGQGTLSKVNDKGFVPDEVRNTFFRKLRMKSENRTCFECPARNPTWISLTWGIYLCLECSGEHRRKGVHISFVRSVELDSFTPEQMVQMAVGGNGKAQEYFKGHEMGKLSSSGRVADYTSKAAERYRAQLEADAKKACEKLGVASKSASQAASKDEGPVDPVDQAADFSFEGPEKAASASPSSKSMGAQSAPSPQAMGYSDSPMRGASAPAVVPTQKPVHTVPSAH